MAIETVKIFNNTSIIQDEVLASRLGLVPLRADARYFSYKRDEGEASGALDRPAEELFAGTAHDGGAIEDRLRFDLFVPALRSSAGSAAGAGGAGAGGGGGGEGEVRKGREVLSRHLVWRPYSGQRERYGNIGPVDDDILIAKLRDGQEIKVECEAVKGIGRVHAKWSPVATASYRLHPDIRLTRPVVGEEAEKIKALCPMGVFDIEDYSKTLKVGDQRKCTMCRECVRARDQTAVDLGRNRGHFIFTVESTGTLPAVDLFREAFNILTAKASEIERLIQEKERQDEGSDVAMDGAK
jgi:DNA-directed RNA polymerase I and III subunit RPAC1